MRLLSIAACVAISCMTPGLSAHHSSADYDPHQRMTLQGVVTEFKWENPHILVYLDVKEADGRLVKWAVEGAPPGRIGGKGMKSAVRAGETVTVTACRAKDPSRRDALGLDLTLSDGRRFIIGSDADLR